MRLFSLLAILLLAAGPTPPAAALGPRPAASPAPRPGDVLVSLTFRAESDAAWAGLAKLGYRAAGELRVMTAGPGGKKACVAVHRGWLPTAALAAARRVAGVDAVWPVPPGGP